MDKYGPIEVQIGCTKDILLIGRVGDRFQDEMDRMSQNAGFAPPSP